MKPRTAVIIDYENITINLQQRGLNLNWEAFIQHLASKFHIVDFHIFAPYHALPGYMKDIRSIPGYDMAPYNDLACLKEIVPCAVLAATSEEAHEKDCTDNHMMRYALSKLIDAEHAPDTLVIGSGDHYFAPVAEIYEEKGKDVVIFSVDRQSTYNGLLKQCCGKNREIIFLLENALFVAKQHEWCFLVGELKMLIDMLLNHSDRQKIKPTNRLFQMLASAYHTAQTLERPNFNEIVQAFTRDYKQKNHVTNHANDWKYRVIIRGLAGNYTKDDDATRVLVRKTHPDGKQIWYVVDRRRKLAKAIESVERRAKFSPLSNVLIQENF